MHWLAPLVVVALGTAVIATTNHTVLLEKELATFLGSIEQYEQTVNDIVFLLDESGSIGAENFPQVLLFTELLVRRFSVSSEYSRVGILTFSSNFRTHVNDIRYFLGRNMCTLLDVIRGIDYGGGGTETREAMIAARDILVQGRNNTNRIIILISDGQSNAGHDPTYIARDLKRDGFIIFAVGVADVNENELLAVASAKDHIYILKNFHHIYEVNKYIGSEIKEVSWDKAPDKSLCNKFCSSGSDCCDSKADCFCGTKGGNYECACQAGYYGNGHKGECYPCRRGTYKDKVGNHLCVPCPHLSATAEEGSTSINDCSCMPGYTGNPTHKVPCERIKCPHLSEPVGGLTVPPTCENVFGSQCSFRCREGFCPRSCNAKDLNQNAANLPWNRLPSEPRTCLANGQWSGVDFHCEKVRCPVLEYPGNGTHNCTGLDMQFGFGTTCQFTCDKGYELTGTPIRTCLLNGTWTGYHVICKAVMCDPLKTNEKLALKPKYCGFQSMPYRSICQYACKSGFILTSKYNGTSDGINQCLADRTWSGAKERLTCTNVEPPNIVCPNSITKSAALGSNYAEVMWDIPIAEDNVYLQSVRITHPTNVRKPPHAFPVGSIKIVYEAADSSGLTDTCSFTVTVIDNEPPKVLFCPVDIEVNHTKRSEVSVKWSEPKFKDNSDNPINVTSNRVSGSGFSWGPPSVVQYKAYDSSGNVAFCKFSVKVKPYPCPYQKPPENGAVSCDNWTDGRLCSVFCHENFEFLFQPQKVYFCSQKLDKAKEYGTWAPMPGTSKVGYKFPWPDCVRREKQKALNISVTIKYVVPECNEQLLQEMKDKFIENVMHYEKMFPGMICPKNKGCSPENVNITCNVPSSRIRRSVSRRSSWKSAKQGFDNTRYRIRHAHLQDFNKKRRSAKPTIAISFTLQLQVNETDDSKTTCEDCDAESMKQRILENSGMLSKDMSESISSVVSDVYKIPSPQHDELSYEITSFCLSGQIMKNNSCLSCPAGTYKDDLDGTCVDCPSATYQDKEASLSCLPCPKDYTTYQSKSTSFSDCKAPCQPGTYSKTLFEPCVACPQNTYQKYHGRAECTKCQNGLSTWKVGANSSSDCVSPCPRGSFSSTGFEPCTVCAVGSYQSKENQVSCDTCPPQTSTVKEEAVSLEQCKEIDFCNTLHPCPEGSTCLNMGSDYKCLCPEGLLGNQCEVNIDDCSSQSCINGGTCVDGINSYICQCPEGFTGLQCEINVDDCEPNPCENGGHCIDHISNYSCVCQAGFTGRTCDVDIFECASNPCQNNGKCFDKLNGYRCCCDASYTGDNCERRVNLCDGVECANGGICFATENDDDFKCICQTGFTGHKCEVSIDYCESHFCHNGGTCINNRESASCLCTPMYDGKHCEEAFPSEYALSYESPLTHNYVTLRNDRRLYEVTVSFFMRTTSQDTGSRATPVSYSYVDKVTTREVDNGFTLSDLNRLVFYLHGQMLHTGFIANSDSNWRHYALTWEKTGGKWGFYVNGKTVVSGSHIGEESYFWPGIFILGQEQDNLGGAFSISESFVGDISQFNVWDHVLLEEELAQVASACSYMGNVISWPMALKNVHGEIKVVNDTNLCNDIGICSKDDCKCLYSNHSLDYFCKGSVDDCELEPCANDQTCSVHENGANYCNCDSQHEGRLCQYDVDECLSNKGNCSNFCVNDEFSYHCSCPEGMILNEDGHTCKETRFCKQDKLIISNDEEWEVDCKTCKCIDGDIICSNKICTTTACQQDELSIHLPGSCCEKCISLPSFCLISAHNSSVTSFKDDTYEFSDTCHYNLLEDCTDGNFKVSLESSNTSSPNRSLSIFVQCTQVQLSVDLAEVNGRPVALPFKNDDVFIDSGNSSIDVWTRFGFTVQLHSTGDVMIAMADDAARRVCGICGKFSIEDTVSKLYYLADRSATGSGCYLKSACAMVSSSDLTYASVTHAISAFIFMCLTVLFSNSVKTV